MQITIGRTVLFTLSEQDAHEINRRRTTSDDIRRRIRKNDPNEMSSSWPLGAQAHIGNGVFPGDVFPLVVTKVWFPDSDLINGQVLLDGNDVFWATSVHEGTVPHTWHWPPRI